MVFDYLSNNLQITNVNLTGLKFSDLYLEPFLNNGIALCFFTIQQESLLLLMTW